MVDVRSGIDHHAQTAQVGAPAQLRIFEIHEQLVREASELAEQVSPYPHRRAARSSDVLQFAQRLRRLAVTAGPRQPAHVEDGAARVEQLRSVEQAQPRHRDSDRRVLQGVCQPIQGARIDNRVGVEKDEHVAARLGGATVAAARVAKVAAGLDQPDAERLDHRAIAAGVVDHDHLGLRLAVAQRAQAACKSSARLKRDDDDRGAQCEAVSTPRGPRARLGSS